MVKHHKILIFASGSGTNAEQIIRHFSPNPSVEVLGVYSNNPSAAVLERVKQLVVLRALKQQQRGYWNKLPTPLHSDWVKSDE